MTKTPGQHEAESVALSVDCGRRIVWKKVALKNGKAQYRVYRIIPRNKPILIRVTTDPATLSRTMRIQVGAMLGTEKLGKPKKNPAERIGEADARRLVENFTGRKVESDEYELVPTPAKVKALAQIGKISAIEYVAFRDDKEYRFRHVFKVRSRPALAVAPDGKTVTMIGGSWKFGEDGFEDQ